MFKAFVLVRNLKPGAERLEFGEFTINRVGLRFSELREAFSFVDVNPDDWVFEKSYPQLPPGPTESPGGGIPNDIEDILLLLRLYHVGDVAFIKLAIAAPNGYTVIRPYRAMNDLNSYSDLLFEIESEKREAWKGFASRIRESRSWSSDWFAVARRFFLSGGAKPFNPAGDDVDRIVDYATALESTLVPERDYNTRRVSRRAAALIAPDDSEETEEIQKLVKKFYDIRSRIVHGGGLGAKDRKWLSETCEQVELRVRQVLVTAVQKLPPGEDDRRVALARLYDPTDDDRRRFVVEKFKEIKTAKVRKAIADEIGQLARE
jgi:hypothetical protein